MIFLKTVTSDLISTNQSAVYREIKNPSFSILVFLREPISVENSTERPKSYYQLIVSESLKKLTCSEYSSQNFTHFTHSDVIIEDALKVKNKFSSTEEACAAAEQLLKNNGCSVISQDLVPFT